MSDVDSARSRLTDHYSAAFTDFHGTPSGAPCVYKTGSAWPKPKDGPETQPYTREMRPVHDHPIIPSWIKFLKTIEAYLESCGVKPTAIAGFGMANAGEAKPFCPLVVNIGVSPSIVAFEVAKTAAEYVKNTILGGVGFGDIDVAIREWTTTLSGRGPKLDSLAPLVDSIAEFRHPFTSTLSLSIAPYKTLYYEGTACLYFRLNKDSDDIFILAAAHVARPPSGFPNTGMSYKNSRQRREEIVNLGSKACDDATVAIMSRIGTLHNIIVSLQNKIERLVQEEGRGDPQSTATSLQEAKQEVERTKRAIAALDQLHSDVTKRSSSLQQRTIGFVLHADPIGLGPNECTLDWAAVQLYNDMFDWDNFKGNRVFVGGKIKEEEYRELMFPNPSDRAGYRYLQDGLLQVYGVVPESEICQPKQLNAYGDNSMPVIKNGKTTGTTVGWMNGLKALVRYYTDNIEFTALESTIVPYGGGRGAFSDKGDSGSIVLDRGGRAVAMITGGGGTTDDTDVTFATAYYELEPRIKEALPGCFLYCTEIVQE